MTDLAQVQPLQPLLHDGVVQLAAPSQAWSATNGDMVHGGIHGFFTSDVRVLDELTLSVAGVRPENIAHARVDGTTMRFTALARTIDDSSADPRVRIERARTIGPGLLSEQIEVANATAARITTSVTVALRADFTPMQLVKAGLRGDTAVSVERTTDGIRLLTGTTDALVSADTVVNTDALVSTDTATVAVDGTVVTLTWPVDIAPGGRASVRWSITASDSAAVVGAATAAPEWADTTIRSGDSRLSSWLRTALDDLQALRMVTLENPADAFLAAGAPWFFTLFGRDSIWAARMLLPLGTDTAAATLRVLASLQGSTEVAETAEQPGKIMHELRPGILSIPGEDVSLPPLYFGTVDATALWICLLHDAWTWGMPDAEVEALLPHLERALAWMRDSGTSAGDGFLRYVDTTGHGLANQGWKDSGDSIQWRDGTLAEGPIALCEVQGYAYEAAIGGAALLEHFGRAGDEWRDWAERLKVRFAESFWIDDAAGAYPAVALDVAGRRVDTVTSNMGHLLGTGILEPDDAELIARRLVSPQLASGFGLRTMSTDSTRYWPLSYHGGSVWTHDTAIAIMGLRRDGFADEAAALIEGLLRAAEGFDYRMPELHSGDAFGETATPIPYPAACRPQAWSATAAVAVAASLLGLDADAQGPSLRISPMAGVGPIEIGGVRFRGERLTVAVDAAGRVTRTPS